MLTAFPFKLDTEILDTGVTRLFEIAFPTAFLLAVTEAWFAVEEERLEISTPAAADNDLKGQGKKGCVDNIHHRRVNQQSILSYSLILSFA